MRKATWLLGLLLFVGCGISKEIYQGEVSRRQDCETRAQTLEQRVAAEVTQKQGLEKTVADLSGKRGELEAELSKAKVRAAELEGQLASEKSVRTREEAAGAKLKAEKDQLAATLSSERSARAQEAAKAEEERRKSLDATKQQYEGLLAAVKGEVSKGQVTISQLKDRLSVNVLDEILFDSGSAKIKPKGMEVLKRVGEALKALKDKGVVIEGHTDNVQLKERLKQKYPTNWELSTARATSVARYLQDEVKLDPTKLSAVGFGEYRPIDTNDTPEGRQRNRRIQIMVVPLEAPVFGAQVAAPK